jgi:hypothetical protein
MSIVEVLNYVKCFMIMNVCLFACVEMDMDMHAIEILK